MNIDRIIVAIPSKTDPELRQMRANAERQLETGSMEQKAAAAAVIDAIDAEMRARRAAEEDRQRAERSAIADRLCSMERPARVAEAFRIEPPTKAEERIIQVLLDNPGSTSTELSAEVGWSGKTWQMHFGIMCQKRVHLLWPADNHEGKDEPVWSGILTDLERTSSGRWGFTMKPEAVAGFEAIGIRAKNAV